MRSTAVLTIIIFSLTAQAGVSQQDAPYALAERADVDELVPLLQKKDKGGLEKRACNYNGCTCNSRGKQLTVCGNCVWANNNAYVVTAKRVDNHIFECSPNGTCCTYGIGSDCGGPNARCIIN